MLVTRLSTLALYVMMSLVCFVRCVVVVFVFWWQSLLTLRALTMINISVISSSSILQYHSIIKLQGHENSEKMIKKYELSRL